MLKTIQKQTNNNNKKTDRRENKHNTKENSSNHKGKNKKKKKGTKNKYKINRKARFKMAINTCLLIITLNTNGINAPIKRHRVSDWIKKKRAYNMLPTRDPL